MSLFLGCYSKDQNSFSAQFCDSNKLIGVSYFEDESLYVIADSHLLNTSCTSDAQHISQIFQKHYAECFTYLLGDFVCIIWDKKRHELFVARDALGQRCLFYNTSPGAIHFSNSVKHILALSHVDKTLDDVAITKFLALIIPDKINTCYKNIKKIQSGTYHHYKPHRDVVIQRFWNPEEIAKDTICHSHVEDYYKDFRHLYLEVINDYLKNKNHIASHLSGGLDSTSVTNIAAGYLKKDQRNIHAISHAPHHKAKGIAKHNWNHDDRYFIEAAANYHSNIQLHYLSGEPELFHYCQQLHGFMEQPPLNPSNTLWMLEAAKTAQNLNCDYLLIGQAGNSTISWPLQPKTQAEQWTFNRMIRHIPARVRHYLQRRKGNYRRSRPWQEYSAINPTLANHCKLVTLNQIETKRRNKTPNEKRDYYLGPLNDYMASLNIAIRETYQVIHIDPTADKRIVELFLRLPNFVFDDGQGRSRLLVREGLKGLMPECVLNRTSRGMQSADWFYWLDAQKKQITDNLNRWQNTDVANYLDIKQLLTLMKNWDLTKAIHSSGQEYHYYDTQYHYKLLRAVEIGLFIESASRPDCSQLIT